MNSVDFKLHAVPGQAPALMLNCAYRRKGRQMDTNHLPLSGRHDLAKKLVVLVTWQADIVSSVAHYPQA